MKINENEITNSIEKLKLVLQSKDQSSLNQLNNELKELLSYLHQYIKDNSLNADHQSRNSNQFEFINEIFKLDTYNCTFNYIYRCVSTKFEEQNIKLNSDSGQIQFYINDLVQYSIPKQQLINYIYHTVYERSIPIDDVIKLYDTLFNLYSISRW